MSGLKQGDRVVVSDDDYRSTVGIVEVIADGKVHVTFPKNKKWDCPQSLADIMLDPAPPPKKQLGDPKPGQRFLWWDEKAAESRLLLVTDHAADYDSLTVVVDVDDGKSFQKTNSLRVDPI